MEEGRERLIRLTSLNKTKQSRSAVIRNFFEKTGMTLSDVQFLSQGETATARTMAYKRVKSCGKPQQLKNLGEVIGDFRKILELNQYLKDEKVIVLHYLDAESGAIIITFGDFSNLFEKIIDFLEDQDIIVFQTKGNFGICFEAEEHLYLKTVWGL